MEHWLVTVQRHENRQGEVRVNSNRQESYTRVALRRSLGVVGIVAHS